jgi:hypothetical protein
MTNGNVEQVVTDVDGETLTVKYKDGDKKITVPPDVPIVTFVPGDKADLKPGIKILIRSRASMTECRFVLVDFRYTNDVVGHIRLYEAGFTYAMRRVSPMLLQSANSLPQSARSIGNHPAS